MTPDLDAVRTVGRGAQHAAAEPDPMPTPTTENTPSETATPGRAS
ncbi:MAG: hypothetical protein ACRDQ5_25490 [Sciscionella sp.]